MSHSSVDPMEMGISTDNPMQSSNRESHQHHQPAAEDDSYSNETNRESLPSIFRASKATVNTTINPIPSALVAPIAAGSSENELHGMDKKYTALGHALAIGICGLVITVMGTTLDTLAANCSRTSVNSGTVFVLRWLGNIVGATSTTVLFQHFTGNYVLGFMLILSVLFLVLLGYNTNNYLLHFYFFALGTTLSVTDTGVQLLTRKLHRKFPGPWLGVNTLMFSVCGVFGPLLTLIFQQVGHIFIFLSSLCIAIALFVMFTRTPVGGGPPPPPPPPPSSLETNTPQSTATNTRSVASTSSISSVNRPVIPHYYVEMAVGFMLFCYTGTSFAATFYLVSYVQDTEVFSSSDVGSTLVFAMWTAMTVGRVFSIIMQVKFSTDTLIYALLAATILSTVGLIIILSDTANKILLFVGLVMYGLFLGPCVSFSFDLNNRLTFISPQGMSWVMFGLNTGANLLPLTVSLWWDKKNYPQSLFYVMIIAMVLTIPVVFIAKASSYRVGSPIVGK